MATNPNDLAKLLNEMMSTLQDLSKKELESVESIIQEQKKNLEVDKKTKDAKKELARIKKETKKTELKLKSEEKKNLEKKNDLLSSLKESTKKLGKHSIKMSFEKVPTVKDLFGIRVGSQLRSNGGLLMRPNVSTALIAAQLTFF